MIFFQYSILGSKSTVFNGNEDIFLSPEGKISSFVMRKAVVD